MLGRGRPAESEARKARAAASTVRRVGRCGSCRAGAERETGDTDGGEAQSGGAGETGSR